MFTGLIQTTARVVAIEAAEGRGKLSLEAPDWNRSPGLGDSIAVNGVCLTLTRHEGATFSFDVLQETFQRTNLGDKAPGDRVNLEASLRYGDELGGHVVTGHVDGVGEVVRCDQVDGRDWVLHVRAAENLLHEMVPKGSIACDGISLTLVEVTDELFSVHLIPHTWAQTALSDIRVGGHVNLETDILAKYAVSLLRRTEPGAPLSWETLGRLYKKETG